MTVDPAEARGRAARRADAGRRLLVAMERLVQEGESFSGTSLQRLIQEAGMSRTLFYAYFRNKSELLNYWAQEVQEETAQSADGWWILQRPDGPEALYDLLSGIIAAYLPHVRVMAAVFDGAAFDAALRVRVEGTINHYAGLFAQHIAAGQRAGWADPRLDPDAAAPWVVWMLDRVHDELLWAAEPDLRELRIRGVAHVIWNMLYAGAPGAPPVAVSAGSPEV